MYWFYLRMALMYIYFKDRHNQCRHIVLLIGFPPVNSYAFWCYICNKGNLLGFIGCNTIITRCHVQTQWEHLFDFNSYLIPCSENVNNSRVLCMNTVQFSGLSILSQDLRDKNNYSDIVDWHIAGFTYFNRHHATLNYDGSKEVFKK